MGANKNIEQRYKLFIYLLSIIKKQILFTVNNKQILLTVSKKQILLTVSKKQIFCVSIVSTLLLLAIFPLAKNIRFAANDSNSCSEHLLIDHPRIFR